MSDRVVLIKAHALNELRHKPESVTAQDRLFLVNEVERLRALVRALHERAWDELGYTTQDVDVEFAEALKDR